MAIELLSHKIVVDNSERISKVPWHPGLKSACRICEVFVGIQIVCHQFRQLLFNLLAHVVTILAMTISNAEVMHSLLSAQVWSERIAVLVHFERISRLMPTRCSERKLSDRI